MASLNRPLDGVDPRLLLALALGHEVVRLARLGPLRATDLKDVLRPVEGRRVRQLGVRDGPVREDGAAGAVGGL